MKKLILTFLAIVIGLHFVFQNSRNLPNVKVKTLQGDAFNISELDNDEVQ